MSAQRSDSGPRIASHRAPEEWRAKKQRRLQFCSQPEMKKKGAGAPGARKRAAAAGGDSDESDSGEAQQRARAREPVYLAPQEWPARDDLRTTAVTTTDAERARLSFAIELLDAFREDTVAELRRRGTGRAGDRPAGFLRWVPTRRAQRGGALTHHRSPTLCGPTHSPTAPWLTCCAIR